MKTVPDPDTPTSDETQPASAGKQATDGKSPRGSKTAAGRDGTNPRLADAAERLQGDIDAMIEALSERVAELAQQTEALAARKRDAARSALIELAEASSARIRQKPLQSMALAAAIGALFALLLGRRD